MSPIGPHWPAQVKGKSQKMIIKPQLRRFFSLTTLTLLLVNCSSLGDPMFAGRALADGTFLQEITCVEGPPAHSVTIFSAHRNFSSAWNHIANPAKAGDFLDLRQAFSRYNTAADQLQEDTSCNSEQTYRAVLVKKFHTWDNTHANGLQTEMDAIPVTKIKNVVIELKLNSAGSVIPSRQQIAEAFPWLTPGQVRMLDRGTANIDLVLSNGAARANKILTIDQSKYADKWLRITIPMQHLNYYEEVDYVRSPRPYDAAIEETYNTLNITAESHNRKTVQSLTGSAGTRPLFKEVDLSIRRIYYDLK
jgi:hypothetical protein